MANYIDDAIDISGLENKTENDGTTAAGRISATEWNTLVTALETEQDNTQTLDGGLKNANDAIALNTAFRQSASALLDGGTRTITETIVGWWRYTDGAYNTTGSGGAPTPWVHSPFIPVNDFVSASGLTYHTGVANVSYFSDADNQAWIGGERMESSSIVKADLTIPSEAVYISVSTDGSQNTLSVVSQAVGLVQKVTNLENSKQDTLESGENIKTINGNSLLGSGNIKIAQEGMQPNIVAGAALNVFGEPSEETFMSRETDATGFAVIDNIKGNTFPVHQLWKILETRTVNSVTITNNGDGTYTMNGTGTAVTNFSHNVKVIAGHKYLYVLRYVSGSISNDGQNVLQQYSNPQLMANSNASRSHAQRDLFYVATCNTSGTLTLRVMIGAITYTNYTFSPFFADLTAMFGAGNEPTTWDEYNAAISENIGAIPYGWDGQELASVKITGISSDGTTSIPVTTLTSNDTVIFPNGLNRVGEDYDEIKVSGGKAVAIRRTAIVDLGDLTWNRNASSGIFFAKLDGNDTGAPFAADKSKPALMSYPYDFDSTTTNQNSLADKSYRLYWWYWNGINIKDADYSDAETFKTAMAGVKLVYALAEPVTYEIDDFTLPLAYHVGQTEQVLPQNTTAIQTSAPTLNIRYEKHEEPKPVTVQNKYVHFSLDDCTFWADLIINGNSYDSCFQSPVLAKLKRFHDDFGIVFTLNCFIVATVDDVQYSISNVPSKFASEFAANKDWLRFAFHGTTTTETFSDTSAETLLGYYNTFVAAIVQMTGTYDCIDRVTRLSSYTGNLANITALRDANCGITGLLCSDNDVNTTIRASYYLTEAQNTYLHYHDKMYDADNYLWFIRTVRRLENSSIAPSVLNTAPYANFRPILEIFWHENNSGWMGDSAYTTRLKPWFEWLNENGYKHVFTADIMHIN